MPCALLAAVLLGICFVTWSEEVAEACTGPDCSDDSPLNDVLLLQVKTKLQGNLENEVDQSARHKKEELNLDIQRHAAGVHDEKLALSVDAHIAKLQAIGSEVFYRETMEHYNLTTHQAVDEIRRNLTLAEKAHFIEAQMRRWGKETLGLLENTVLDRQPAGMGPGANVADLGPGFDPVADAGMDPADGFARNALGAGGGQGLDGQGPLAPPPPGAPDPNLVDGGRRGGSSAGAGTMGAGGVDPSGGAGAADPCIINPSMCLPEDDLNAPGMIAPMSGAGMGGGLGTTSGNETWDDETEEEPGWNWSHEGLYAGGGRVDEVSPILDIFGSNGPSNDPSFPEEGTQYAPAPGEGGDGRDHEDVAADELQKEMDAGWTEIAAPRYERKERMYCSEAPQGKLFDSLEDCRAERYDYCNWLCADRVWRGTHSCDNFSPSQCSSFCEKFNPEGLLTEDDLETNPDAIGDSTGGVRDVTKTPPNGQKEEEKKKKDDPTAPTCINCVNQLAMQSGFFPVVGKGLLCYWSYFGLNPPWPCSYCHTEMRVLCGTEGGEADGAFDKVGEGFCRPSNCHDGHTQPEKCRTNGYWRPTQSNNYDCRKHCEGNAHCIGYALDSSQFCWIYTNGGKVPDEWDEYKQDFYDIGGSDGMEGTTCYKYAHLESSPPPPPVTEDEAPPPAPGPGGVPVIPTPAPPSPGPEFKMILTGTCASQGYWNIFSAFQCGKSGKSLDLPDTVAGLSDKRDVPSGCYFKPGTPNEELWFAENEQDNPASSERQLICQTRAPTFILIRANRCETAPGQYKGVKDVVGCNAAAAAMRLEKTEAEEKSQQDLPQGCVYTGTTKANTLMYNAIAMRNTATPKNAVVCVSVNAPAPAPVCTPIDGSEGAAAASVGWLQMSSYSGHASPCPPGQRPGVPSPPQGQCTVTLPENVQFGAHGCQTGVIQAGSFCELKCPFGQKPHEWTNLACNEDGQTFTHQCREANPCAVVLPQGVTFTAGHGCGTGIIQFGARCEIMCPAGSGRVGVSVLHCTEEATMFRFDCTAAMMVAVFGDIGGNACPAGAEHITAADECASLSKCLGKTGEIVPVSLNDRPRGCFASDRSASGEASFNHHATGAAHAGSSPICKQSGQISNCPGACSGTRMFGFCPPGNGCVNGQCQSAIPVAMWDYTASDTCPSGAETISSEAECRALSRCVGRSGNTATTDDTSHPGGCFAMSLTPDNSDVHFNRNTVGGNTQTAFKLCKKMIPRNAVTGECLAQYIAGTKATNTCPSGFIRVPAYSQCGFAGQSLGAGFGNFQNDDPWGGGPNGCMRQGSMQAGDGPNDIRWYNQRCCGGGTHPDYYPICTPSVFR